MHKTTLSPEDFQKLSLLAAHIGINAPHQPRFHNFAADFRHMFPTEVGHVDQRDDYRSALSPTAYLVDLVRLVSEHITPPDDDRLGLALPNRRPDIFDLELSRDKAERTVPYLEIANQVMQTYLEKTLQVKPSALEQLAQSRFPFGLPFHLPLTRIRAYLQHFQINLADIYAAFGLGMDDPAWVAETLKLAPGELGYFTTPKATPADLNEAFGVTTISDTSLGGLDEVATFLAQTDLTHAQLESLVKIRVPNPPTPTLPSEPLALDPVVAEGVAQPQPQPTQAPFNSIILAADTKGADGAYVGMQITITKGQAAGQTRTITGYTAKTTTATGAKDWDGPPSSLPDGTSEYTIRSTGHIGRLNLTTLDYLNRFNRLAQRLGWSFDDLNWALTSIDATLTKSVADNQADLKQLAKIEYLHNKYKLPIDVLCSSWSDLRTTPPFDQPSGDSLRDRILNPKDAPIPDAFTLGMVETVPEGVPPSIRLAAATPAGAVSVGMQISITAGAGSGQTRTITGYNDTTNIATVDVAWGPLPDATSRYAVVAADQLQTMRAALLSALKVDDATYNVILDHLLAVSGGSLTNNLTTLTRLYRLSRLALMLGMPVNEYLALLQLITQISGKPEWYLVKPEVCSIDDLITVVNWADWLTATGLNALELQYLKATVEAPSRIFALIEEDLQCSDDQGGSWYPARGVPGKTITGIVASEDCLVANSGDDFYFSRNGGVDWTRVSGKIEDKPITRLRAGRRSNRIFAANSDDVLHVSKNDGVSWEQFKLSATDVQDVCFLDDLVFFLNQDISGGIVISESESRSWQPGIEIGITGVSGSNNRLIATTNGHGFLVNKITKDKQTWSLIGGEVAEKSIEQIVASGNRLIVVTAAGLYYGDDPLVDGQTNSFWHIDARTWTPVSGEMAQKTVKQLVACEGCVVAAANDGLYVSEDDGTNWRLASRRDVTQVAVVGRRGLSTLQPQYVTNGSLSDAAAHAVSQVLTRAAATTAVNNYLKKVADWAVKPAAFTHSGVDATLASSISKRLVWRLLDDHGLVIQATAKLTTDAVKSAIGASLKKSLQDLFAGPKDVATADGTHYEAYIKSIVTTLQDALDQQTKGTIVYWSGVFGAETALIAAALSHVAAESGPSETQTPIAPGLVQKCTGVMGKAQAGAATTITLAGDDAQTADTYIGRSIIIKAGLGAGHHRTIAKYDQITKVATVKKAWKTVPDSTAHYAIVNLPIVNLAVVDQIALLLYLAKALALSAQQLQPILDHADTFGLDLSGAMTRIPLDALRQLADFKQLMEMFARQGDATKTAAYVDAQTTDHFANSATGLLRNLQPAGDSGTAELSLLSGWDADQIVALDKHLTGMAGKTIDAADGGVTSPTNFAHTIGNLSIMRRCFDLAARLGIHIQLLINLYNLHSAAEQNNSQGWPEYASTAQAFLSVLRSKYSSDDWSKTFGPIRDHLNELERDALTAFLLPQLQAQFGDIKSRQDLYEFLLVDVEMSGCARTTVVREAIDCLQIYIQRCRMNLEVGVTLSQKIPDVMWDWMGHFRLWQANRKLFFYPENYLDPTLRTRDATPEFQALQSELLQGDINKDTTEQAYINYFDKLEQLANLKIVNGCYAKVHNPNSGNPEATLFLIGRTATEPPVYYQRRAILKADAKGELTGDITHWSPWQKIDVNIAADQALPLYAADRLYIFWVEQKTITDRDKDDKKVTTTTATIKFSYQQLSGKWMQPQVLKRDVDVKNLPPTFAFAPGGSNDPGHDLIPSRSGEADAPVVLSQIADGGTGLFALATGVLERLFASPVSALYVKQVPSSRS